MTMRARTLRRRRERHDIRSTAQSTTANKRNVMAQMGWVGVGGRRNVPLSIDRTRDTSQRSMLPLNAHADLNTARRRVCEQPQQQAQRDRAAAVCGRWVTGSAWEERTVFHRLEARHVPVFQVAVERGCAIIRVLVPAEHCREEKGKRKESEPRMRRVAGSACGNILSCIVRTRETSQFSRLPLNEDARANTAKKEMREHQRNNSRQMGGWFARGTGRSRRRRS
jgi:hypothetical protein